MNNKELTILSKRNIFFFIFCLYPWLLISGPFLSDLFAIILSVYFIYEKFSRKSFNEFKTIYFFSFAIFCLYLFFNSVFIAKHFLSIQSSIFYVRFFLFSLAIVFLLEENENRLRYFFYSVCLVIFVLFIDSLFQKIFETNLVGIDMQHAIRVSSFFGNELILGSFTIKLLPIALAFLFFVKQNKTINFSILLIFLSSVIVLLSAEKTALIMTMLLFVLFILKIKLIAIYRLFLFITFASLISLILFSSQSLNKRLIQEFAKNYSDGKYIYSRPHDSHYKTAYKMFKDKPLLGHGPKMFRVKCSDQKYVIDQFSCSTHPHNYLLQILSETGLIGFLFWSIFYLSVLLLFIKLLIFEKSSKGHSFPLYIMCSSILIIFLPIAPSGNIFNNWLSCLNFFSIGVMMFFLKKIKY